MVDGANAVAGAVTDGTGLIGDALTDAYNQAADKVPWSVLKEKNLNVIWDVCDIYLILFICDICDICDVCIFRSRHVLCGTL